MKYDVNSHLSIIPLLSARHQYKQEGDLFGTILGPHKRINCQELCKGMPTQLECPVNVPCLCPGEVVKLFFCGEDEMAASLNLYISAEKIVWQMVFV